MTKVYDKLGLHFQYPDNWTLDDEGASEPGDSVAVYSPGGAFWLVTQHEGPEPGDLADEALRAMEEEYEDLESEPVEEWIEGHQAVGYDLNFWYLDLTSTSWIRCVATEHGTFVVLCQSEDREFDDVAPVFQAITSSLLAG
jgi:hypothetical protein